MRNDNISVRLVGDAGCWQNEKDRRSKIRLNEWEYLVTVLNDSYTLKPVLNDHSKIDKTKILMTNGYLMKVKSIAECSLWSILQYF